MKEAFCPYRGVDRILICCYPVVKTIVQFVGIRSQHKRMAISRSLRTGLSKLDSILTIQIFLQLHLSMARLLYKHYRTPRWTKLKPRETRPLMVLTSSRMLKRSLKLHRSPFLRRLYGLSDLVVRRLALVGKSSNLAHQEKAGRARSRFPALVPMSRLVQLPRHSQKQWQPKI